jgi:hypothetical protein
MASAGRRALATGPFDKAQGRPAAGQSSAHVSPSDLSLRVNLGAKAIVPARAALA